MHKDLLATSPLLGLSIAALFLFLAVFVAVVIRVMTRNREELDEAARLPLASDEEDSR